MYLYPITQYSGMHGHSCSLSPAPHATVSLCSVSNGEEERIKISLHGGVSMQVCYIVHTPPFCSLTPPFCSLLV